MATEKTENKIIDLKRNIICYLVNLFFIIFCMFEIIVQNDYYFFVPLFPSIFATFYFLIKVLKK